jgi:F0F1-type ATP synthase membrane subunit a
MICLELFVSFIQAFIFTMLAGVYIAEALEPRA